MLKQRSNPTAPYRYYGPLLFCDPYTFAQFTLFIFLLYKLPVSIGKKFTNKELESSLKLQCK